MYTEFCVPHAAFPRSVASHKGCLRERALVVLDCVALDPGLTGVSGGSGRCQLILPRNSALRNFRNSLRVNLMPSSRRAGGPGGLLWARAFLVPHGIWYSGSHPVAAAGHEALRMEVGTTVLAIGVLSLRSYDNIRTA